ncbi:MAG: hypothetical protein ACI3ZE_03500 [Candidatus Woodwardiibium sp.]
MKKILIITPARVRESDLIETIRRVGCEVTLTPKTALPALDASGYDAVVISGGTESEPMTFTPAEREAADRLSRSGVRVFAEFCQYLGAVNCPNVESTRYARPVSRFRYGEIIEGDILDEQCNTRVVHFYASESRIPLLSYRANPEGFYTLKNYADAEFPVSADALWTEHDTLLFCTFRLADFAKACFAPRKKWFSLIGFILLWLTGEKHDLSFLDAFYAQNAYSTTPCEGTDVELARAAERAMDWHEKGGFLLPPDENGCRAVLEGVGAAVLPDGTHSALHNYTTVSTGETALAYYLQSLYTGDDNSRRISDELLASGRRHIADAADETDGWGRSGDNAWWNVCYQDDDARGLLFPRLLRALYGEALPDADAVRRNLDFLLRTTGTDGLRVARTELVDDKKLLVQTFEIEPDASRAGKWRWGGGRTLPIAELRAQAGGSPSAHYNGYYLAALLLAYKVLGDERYRDTAVRGLETIMAHFPNTAREHSETQELCRLILPLSYLYWVTGEEKHRTWLYAVTRSLLEKQHSSGAFIEWDTGYNACCAGAKDGESSVLAANGDPVADMLYSMNWLPFSLMQAYFITHDDMFLILWRRVCGFLASIQLCSRDKRIDGAWPRAFDVEQGEVYGVPNDVGWSPWSVECGWTMGQIPIGLYCGLLRDRLLAFYGRPGENR